MKTIYKYEMDVFENTKASFEMDANATIVSVGVQQGEILNGAYPNPKVIFWAEVDTKAATDLRFFEVFGTGHEISVNSSYLGTAELKAHGLVLHLHEIIPMAAYLNGPGKVKS